ncbi:MAG: NusG domain II-containing protein [candidate division WOR-3 bacterium]
MWQESRFHPLKIGDLFVIIFFLLFIFFIPRSKGEKVIISVDNRDNFVYPLTQDRELIIKGKIGYAKVIIKDGKARILDAPCPLKICEKKGWISKKGESIICIPNRVVIKITGKEYDAITE